MTILFFDTETTGKKKKGVKPDDPRQPHIVQLAAILTDDDLSELASINVTVYPYDWTIPDEAAKIHGITQEIAEEKGIGLTDALKAFGGLAYAADRFVAHNIEYDAFVMRREQRYVASILGDTSPPLDFFGSKELRCSMKAATKVVRILHADPKHPEDFKYPSLTECHQHFFGEAFDGAHDAMADIRATMRVYKALCDHYGMAP